jgi:hypothetical protein
MDTSQLIEILTISKVFEKFFILLFMFRFGWECLQIPRLQKCGPPEKRGSAIISIKTKNINNYQD